MTATPAAFAQFGQTLAFAERTLTATLRAHLAERDTAPETWYALQLIATRGPGLDREALSRDLEGSPASPLGSDQKRARRFLLRELGPSLRWNCIAATDPKLFQAPFRAASKSMRTSSNRSARPFFSLE